ncbi:MAG: HIT domain-containing protein [Chloroflexi bacterium]|nr:HIT domain-containing protein [Chloroflexota bacterium]
MACLFCQIASGEVAANIVYKSEGVTAFRDVAPQAPTHILVIPDRHIAGAAEVTSADEVVVGRLVRVAAEAARMEGITDRGYRLIINQGHDAGQSIDHLHVHLLGGRPLPTPLV